MLRRIETPGIRLDGISKSFGTSNILKNVSLDIAAGEFITLLGPSGCGKSTLLRIIAGLENPDRGEVLIGGRDVTDIRPKRRDVAMVFQSYALYPHMTVEQNIGLPLRMRRLTFTERLPLVAGWSPRQRQKLREIGADVETVATALEIEHLLKRKPGQLSGGQRQRVALGRAMVRNPAVFLMDEPLSNLDAKLRLHMRMEIVALHRRLGSTFVYVTHDQAEAMTMSDRVAVVLNGEILQVSAPDQIYCDPQDRRVAEFVGSPKINIIPAIVGDGGAPHISGRVFGILLEALSGSPVDVGVRPEHLQPVEAGRSILSGTVKLIENMGPDIFLHVDAPLAGATVVSRIAPEASHFHLGQAIHLGCRTSDILVFGPDGRRMKTRLSSARIESVAS